MWRSPCRPGFQGLDGLINLPRTPAEPGERTSDPPCCERLRTARGREGTVCNGADCSTGVSRFSPTDRPLTSRYSARSAPRRKTTLAGRHGLPRHLPSQRCTGKTARGCCVQWLRPVLFGCTLPAGHVAVEEAPWHLRRVELGRQPWPLPLRRGHGPKALAAMVARTCGAPLGQALDCRGQRLRFKPSASLTLGVCQQKLSAITAKRQTPNANRHPPQPGLSRLPQVPPHA